MQISSNVENNNCAPWREKAMLTTKSQTKNKINDNRVKTLVSDYNLISNGRISFCPQVLVQIVVRNTVRNDGTHCWHAK